MSDTITPRESFKQAFCQRCAENGLTFEQTEALATKLAAAIEKRGNLIEEAGNVLTPAAKKLSDVIPTWASNPTAAALLLGAPAAGYAAGNIFGRLKGDYLDPEDVKKQETIKQYRMLARQLAQAKAPAAI